MKITETDNPKIKFGGGNIFDVDDFGFDGLGLYFQSGFNGLNWSFQEWRRNMEAHHIPTVVYGYNARVEPLLKLEQVNASVKEMLDILAKAGCRNIGFHGVKVADGTYLQGAQAAYNAIREWVSANADKIDSITLVDINDDFARRLE